MPEVVIAGAGIAGVSTAFHLAESGLRDVVICDPLPPLTLTSDKSTECYRNWWPGPDDTMVTFMTRSIELLRRYAERSNDFFHLNRRGYLYVTADKDNLERLLEEARTISELGGGPLRHDPPDQEAASGADVFTTGEALLERFGYLAPDVAGGIHVRNAGWLSAQQLGAWWLDEARSGGVRLEARSVVGLETNNRRVAGVLLSDGSEIACDVFINAAGPHAPSVAAMTGEPLPLHSEAHFKVGFRDTAGTVPRNAPMMIWCDEQRIDWTPAELTALEEAGRTELAGVMPRFCHGRPEGPADSPWVLALWEYHREVVDPVWPMPADPLYAEVVLKGMSRMVPTMAAYRDALPQCVVDGGYYTKTPENRPLIGPHGFEGSFVVAGMSGFGIMAAAAAGELVAAHVNRTALPSYAGFLVPARYGDPAYAPVLAAAGDGQL